METNFVCQICSEKFSELHVLILHYLSHEKSPIKTIKPLLHSFVESFVKYGEGWTASEKMLSQISLKKLALEKEFDAVKRQCVLLENDKKSLERIIKSLERENKDLRAQDSSNKVMLFKKNRFEEDDIATLKKANNESHLYQGKIEKLKLPKVKLKHPLVFANSQICHENKSENIENSFLLNSVPNNKTPVLIDKSCSNLIFTTSQLNSVTPILQQPQPLIITTSQTPAININNSLQNIKVNSQPSIPFIITSQKPLFGIGVTNTNLSTGNCKSVKKKEDEKATIENQSNCGIQTIKDDSITEREELTLVTTIDLKNEIIAENNEGIIIEGQGNRCVEEEQNDECIEQNNGLGNPESQEENIVHIENQGCDDIGDTKVEKGFDETESIDDEDFTLQYEDDSQHYEENIELAKDSNENINSQILEKNDRQVVAAASQQNLLNIEKQDLENHASKINNIVSKESISTELLSSNYKPKCLTRIQNTDLTVLQNQTISTKSVKVQSIPSLPILYSISQNNISNSPQQYMILEQIYPCSICGKQYISNECLAKHVLAKHKAGDKNQPKDRKLSIKDITVEEQEDIVTEDLKTNLEIHKCSLCDKEYDCAEALSLHMRVHTNENPYRCLICEKDFENKENFRSHMEKHSNEKPFKCNYCGKRFLDKNYLNNHKLEHTGEAKHKCEYCNRTFSHAFQLKRHVVTHTGEKPYLCSVCGKSFAFVHYLTIHMRCHTNERRYHCSICDKAFKRCGHLKQHMSTHTAYTSENRIYKRRPRLPDDLKKYKCDICQNRFSTRQGLKQHQVLHDGNKPWKCATCSKSFTTKFILVQHERVHTGEKPYPCSWCGKKFAQNGQLTIHMRFHTGERHYHCDYCDKSFTHKGALIRHHRVHTGERPYSCSVCGKTFNAVGNLKYHLKLHNDDKPYRCEVCGKRFIRKTQLLSHIEAQHN